MGDTSDNERLERRKKASAWTDAELAEYNRVRTEVSLNRIFNRVGTVDPRTGRARRTLKIEKGPGVHGWVKSGYQPLAAWRTPRREPSDE